MQQVSYLGYLVSAQGLETLPEHISPVLEAPPAPSNVAELKSHLGMLTYYHWFLPDVSTKLEPLHELLCSGQAWKWTAARQMVFEKTKRMLQEVPLLVHYHPNKPISGVIWHVTVWAWGSTDTFELRESGRTSGFCITQVE